jgi:hypothetical protein
MGAALPSMTPLRGPEVQKVCALSGLQTKLYGQRLVELEDIEKVLDLSINEANAAISEEKKWVWLLIAAKSVKLSCDVTLDVLTYFTGPAGKGISMIYERAALITSGLNGGLDEKQVGQHIAETHIDALASGLEYMGKAKSGAVIGSAKTLVKSSLAIREIVNDYQSLQNSGIVSARGTLINQLRRVKAQIAQLREELANCEPRPLAQG